MTLKIKRLINKLGYDIGRIRKSQFTVGDITYIAEPCSIGDTPQGETTATGAIRMIEQRQLEKLKILDICCGLGVVGLTIFSNFRNQGIVKEAAFADINIFNLNSLNKTLRENKLDNLMGSQIHCYLSDGLNNIPPDEKFDIIVSNPPHYFNKDFGRDKTVLTPARLGTYDSGWSFHKSFYSQCHNYLTPKGEVWFLENSSGAKEEDLLPFIQANEKLKYVRMIQEPLDPRFFWMITTKA